MLYTDSLRPEYPSFKEIHLNVWSSFKYYEKYDATLCSSSAHVEVITVCVPRGDNVNKVNMFLRCIRTSYYKISPGKIDVKH